MLQSICRVLGHQRSKRKARALATTWSSECRICGQRIVRIKRRRWILTREMHDHASELYGPTFARCWPVDQSFCFDELLQSLDMATAEKKQAQSR
jgi:cellulase/cellobiase CelA1